LKQQEATRSSLDSGATNVVTTSAAIMTLLSGLAALATGQGTIHLALFSSAFVSTAVVAFAIAALRAVRVLRPRAYRGPKVGSLRKATDTRWGDSRDVALKRVVRTQLTMLDAAKISNEQKAFELKEAIGFEVGAAVVLAAGAVLVLLGL
jgi:hypothetical protein